MARCPKAGGRVTFNPNPAAAMFYTHARDPQPGEKGTITTVPIPGGRRTCLPGPRGGLIYVKWDESGTSGVFPDDLKKASGLTGARRKRRRR